MKQYSSEQPKLKALLRSGKQFLLLGHIDPDGDALGAMFGMSYILKKMKKVPVIGLNQPLPSKYDFLSLDDSIKIISPEKVNLNRFSAVIAFDAGDYSRLGRFQGVLDSYTGDIPIINIDHHISNDQFGSLNIVDPGASSASQMVLELMGARVLDRNAAYCLYAGIVYDTGSFRHGNGLRRAHEVAAACLTYDIDPTYIYDQFYSIETEGSLKLFARALDRLQVVEKGIVAYMFLRAEDYKEYRLPAESASGFINRMRLLEGAQITIFFNEAEKNVVKISFRSNIDFNVADFASKFGGGGHAKAAGCRIEGNLDKIVERVLRSLRLATS